MGGKTDSLEPCYARRQFLLQHCYLRVPGIDKDKTWNYIIFMINHITILHFFHRCMKLSVNIILNCSGLQVPARPVGAHHVPGQPGQRGGEEGEESIFIYFKLLFLHQKCPNWSKLFCYLRRSNNSIALVTIGTTAGQKEISLVETSD